MEPKKLIFSHSNRKYTIETETDNIKTSLFLNGKEEEPVDVVFQVTTIRADDDIDPEIVDFKYHPKMILDKDYYDNLNAEIKKDTAQAKKIIETSKATLQELFSVKKLPASPDKLADLIINNLPFAIKSLEKTQEAYYLHFSAKLFKLTPKNILEPLSIHHAALAFTRSDYENSAPPKIKEYFLKLLAQCAVFGNNVSENLSDVSPILQSVTYLEGLDDNFPDIDFDFINGLFNNLPKQTGPLTNFAYSFLNASIKNLEEMNVLRQCPSCSILFPFKQKKIYCSSKCSKKSANSRSYMKNREKIIPKARIVTKENRAVYKKMGIKK